MTIPADLTSSIRDPTIEQSLTVESVIAIPYNNGVMAQPG